MAIGECAVSPGEASYAARSSTHFRVVRGPDEEIHLCSLNSICHQDFQYIGTRDETREWRSFRERDEIDLERVAQLVLRMSTTAQHTGMSDGWRAERVVGQPNTVVFRSLDGKCTLSVDRYRTSLINTSSTIGGHKLI